MTKTRVVVVDDSALVRSLLSEIINRQTDMTCVGVASDPYAARELIRNVDPDVITLDVEMPKMDGLDFLARLMRLRPMPVVMVSTLTERGAEVTLKALELGAVDFVAKPKIGVADGMRQLAADITDKIRVAARATVHRAATPLAGGAGAPRQEPQPAAPGGPGESARPVAAIGRLSTEKIIFIGASTGGTEATKEVLMSLPPDAPAVAITQHMPPGFTTSYAKRLDGLCRIRVAEARDGERLLPGHAYIAPGGLHLSVERSGANYIARVRDGEPVNRHRPSVEVLFGSAARVVGPNALGVMLTGMGADGARAMREMRDAGSFNIAQDEASCVVFGMPREAIAHGAAHEVLPLKQIGPRLIDHLRSTAGVSTNRV
ncbi:chemotaxis response regulator protein-glutamate methylesterase [Aquabacterium sp. J223]|uniref:protein-glutamate methylesterase/protein-glutamine glutaminase n=1 Tax=Aquabacterium sp. J223 TaxID=2898431 RepID=UPI0021AD788F|nr:chemotaxis response regulator protein-glutamate methylesterase [Aquabacterium sp. J223]UUX95266.1 chemotaxis response regulator protein-glutamate methylesterase [Aquabacterium sp. J223]